MALFDPKVQEQLKNILKSMKDEVKIIYFTQEIECPLCRDTRAFVEEIASLNSKLSVEVYNLVLDRDRAELYGVDKIPGIVLLDKNGKDHGIKFYGLPGGYEINSFLGALLEVSGHKEEIPPQLMERIRNVDRDVHIQVFVSLGCPHCPGAVTAAHRLALENPKIKVDMIDTNNFVPLAQRYNISGVPKIVFNDKFELVGAHPINTFLDVIDRLREVSVNID